MNTSKKNWITYLTVCLFFFYEGIQMSYFNSIGESLLKQFSLSYMQLSFLSAAYFYFTALMLIPAGIILDKYNPKKVLLIAMLISILSGIMFSQSKTFFDALFWRIMLGLSGGAFAFIGPLRVASSVFTGKKLSFSIGVLITFGMVGGIVAQAPIAILTEYVQWRNATLIYSAFGGIIWIANLFVYRIIKAQRNHSESSVKMVFKLFYKAIQNPASWIAALFVALSDAPVNLLGTLWGQQYFISTKFYTQNLASALTSILFVGIMIGGPLIGWFGGDGSRKKKVMFIVSMLTVILTLIFVMAKINTPFIMGGICFFLGATAGVQTLGYSTVIEFNPPEIAGIASSMVSFVVIGLGAILRQVYALILTVSNSQNVSSSQAYKYASLMLIVCAFLTCCLAFSLLKIKNARKL